MSSVLMGFVGDVHVNRDCPIEIFSKVKEILEAPQVMFANLEGAYTDDPRLLGSYRFLCAPTRMLDVYARAGFNVMSLANNHVADAGYDAMLQTKSYLGRQGVRTCGAGACLVEAREPAIIEAKGLRIAFLAYACVFPIGWEARANAPGLAPMRAYNSWREPFGNYHMPGIVPSITTVPDQMDLAYLMDDIRRAKERADLVITSFHWGDQFRQQYLTDHEIRTAKYCVDCGADMVVGHHQHALRGMEWYRGKPIMYGLGHFVLDVKWEWSKEEAERFSSSEVGRYFSQVGYEGGPQEGWPLHAFPKEYRVNAVAWATASREGVTGIGFIPCSLAPNGLVYPLAIDSEEGAEAVAYVTACNRNQGLKGRIVSDGAISMGGFQTVRVIAA